MAYEALSNISTHVHTANCKANILNLYPHDVTNDINIQTIMPSLNHVYKCSFFQSSILATQHTVILHISSGLNLNNLLVLALRESTIPIDWHLPVISLVTLCNYSSLTNSSRKVNILIYLF